MKKFISFLFVVLILSTNISASAEKPNLTKTQAAQTTGSGMAIVPFAAVTEIKYRTSKGKIQYRRWNKTLGYWVDPYWINL